MNKIKMGFNIYDYFFLSLKNKTTLFYLSDGNSFSYSEIDGRIAKYCNYFKEIGLKKGDRVVQQTEKCIDSLCIYLASLRYGTTYIPLNTQYKLDEILYFIKDSEPTLFICNDSTLELFTKERVSVPDSLKIETISNKDNVDGIQSKINDLSNLFITEKVKEYDIACILYTSGTTGKPKGAMLSYGNLLYNGLALKSIWGFDKKDILLHSLPIFHSHGLFFAVHCVLLSGASMYFLSKFDVDSVVELLPNCTVFMGVPTYYNRLLSSEKLNNELCRQMRLFISGSAPLPKKTFYEFKNRMGMDILERYGMTETGINSSNPLNGDRIPGTVGLPLPGTEIRVVDDFDIMLKTYESGNIQVKGKHVFMGYWKKPDKTVESFAEDGFFRTGDIGRIDERGYVSIIGRTSDMIISGGFNVYPKEVENAINGIKGVCECAVFGVPHIDFGEAVTAVIVPDKGISIESKMIIKVLKEKLAGYKVPKKVFFVKDIKRNAMGKVQKFILRKQYENVYDLL